MYMCCTGMYMCVYMYVHVCVHVCTYVCTCMYIWFNHNYIHISILAKETNPIKITFPDGKTMEAESWRTTPYDIACKISKGLADNTVISKVRWMVRL